jgi:esterase/lipase superfamily enzyme
LSTRAHNGDLDEAIHGFLVSVLGLEERLRTRIDANLQAADDAMRAARANPFVEGSTGQLRPHPGFTVAATCDDRALALYRELTSGLQDVMDQIGAWLLDDE